MKGMKKLLSILMVLTLVLSLGAMAFAAEANTVTVTVNDPGHTYTAYQIFKGESQNSEGVIGDLDWGDGITPATFISALKEAGFEIPGENPTAQDVAKVLSVVSGDENLHKVAVAAKSAIIEGKGKALTNGSEDFGIGYYLIVDTTANLPTNEMQNDLVLQVTQDITVTPKRDVPESEKKVKEQNDSEALADGTNPTGWQDAADYDIGDHVPFQFTGTLPNNYSSYEKYVVTFHDDQSAGLTFDGISSVKVSCGGTTYKLPHDGITVTENVDHGEETTHSFDISIDVKAVFPTEAVNDGKITVEYTSTLNEGAKIGKPGNPNDMYMEYTNKFDGSGTTTTPVDQVIVFTFDTIVNKTDGAKELKGAGFTLYKEVPADGAITVSGHDGHYYKEIKVFTAGDMTKFAFSGLDSGKYLLVETEVPNGYNKADDIEFTIEGKYDANSAEGSNIAPELKELHVYDAEGNDLGADGTAQFTVQMEPTDNSGSITTDVVNQKGATLPETGGIGTTIFYIAGAILVAGAVIILVTKKRVSGAEK